MGAPGRTFATRYRVIAPDLRGHGESTLTAAFRFEDVVADVFALLDEVRTDAPLALVGLSLGGNIAQEIVYRAPDRGWSGASDGGSARHSAARAEPRRAADQGHDEVTDCRSGNP
jgi:pimeloyl-ACP methyl ester carboxylesterase